MKKFVKIMALVLALVMMVSLASCSKKVTLKILETEYVTEDYAICVAKENEELLNTINGALETLIANGTVKQVVDYYISGTGELPAYQQID